MCNNHWQGKKGRVACCFLRIDHAVSGKGLRRHLLNNPPRYQERKAASKQRLASNAAQAELCKSSCTSRAAQEQLSKQLCERHRASRAAQKRLPVSAKALCGAFGKQSASEKTTKLCSLLCGLASGLVSYQILPQDRQARNMLSATFPPSLRSKDGTCPPYSGRLVYQTSLTTPWLKDAAKLKSDCPYNKNMPPSWQTPPEVRLPPLMPQTSPIKPNESQTSAYSNQRNLQMFLETSQ